MPVHAPLCSGACMERWTVTGNQPVFFAVLHEEPGCAPWFTDLSRFKFPGDEYPLQDWNLSDWVDGEGITIRLVGMIDNIKDAPVFQNRAFSLRMLLLPMGLGKSLIWLVCAP